MSNEPNDNRVLDLDALFGAVESPKVRWAGKQYALKPTSAFGTQDIVKIDSLRKQARGLQSVGKPLNPVQSLELEEMATEMLLMLNPKLPVKEMPFLARAAALEYYFEKANPPAQKKMMAQTGKGKRKKKSR